MSNSPNLDKLEELSHKLHGLLHGQRDLGAMWMSFVGELVQELVDFAATLGITAKDAKREATKQPTMTLTSLDSAKGVSTTIDNRGAGYHRFMGVSTRGVGTFAHPGCPPKLEYTGDDLRDVRCVPCGAVGMVTVPGGNARTGEVVFGPIEWKQRNDA